jgi:hypothetical protein
VVLLWGLPLQGLLLLPIPVGLAFSLAIWLGMNAWKRDSQDGSSEDN